MKKALLVSCFDWYSLRLNIIRDTLKEKGYDVTILLGDFDHLGKKEYTNKHSDCTYIHVPGYKKIFLSKG